MRVQRRTLPCRLTRERYNQLIEGFKRHPSSPPRAAAYASVDQRTARRAWSFGWDRPEWATRPIREIIEQEQIKSRAEEMEARLEEAQKRQSVFDRAKMVADKSGARLDAEHQRTSESQGIRVLTQSAVGLAAQVAIVSSGMGPLIERTKVELAAMAKATTVDPNMVIKMQAALARTTVDVSRILASAMQLARLYQGEPGRIIAITGDVPKPVLDGHRLADAIGGEEALDRATASLFNGDLTPEVQKLIDAQIQIANEGRGVVN